MNAELGLPIKVNVLSWASLLNLHGFYQNTTQQPRAHSFHLSSICNYDHCVISDLWVYNSSVEVGITAEVTYPLSQHGSIAHLCADPCSRTHRCRSKCSRPNFCSLDAWMLVKKMRQAADRHVFHVGWSKSCEEKAGTSLERGWRCSFS
jgi:hypothetical protein